MTYQNHRVRHLPFGAWVRNDQSVVLFNRLHAPMFEFVPRKGVVRLGGTGQDAPVLQGAVAALIFRFDGTFNTDSRWFDIVRVRNLERCLVEWTVAAETTRLDPHEARKMKRPYTPTCMRRYVDEDGIGGKASRVLRNLDRAWYPGTTRVWPAPANAGTPPGRRRQRQSEAVAVVAETAVA